MKKFMLLAIVAMFATMNVFADDNQKTISNQEDDSFITCQFSLNKYTGTVDDAGNVINICVGVSYPQDEDVRATVFVYIDGKRIASQVITIRAGYDYSGYHSISVGKDYARKSYELDVQ